MCSKKMEISEIVKKCKTLLLDIGGTTTSISFVKETLFPYVEENVKEYLASQWDTDDVKEVVTALRKLAIEDEEKKVEGLITIPGEDASKVDQIEGLLKNIKWQMSLDRKTEALKTIQVLIWKQGYDNGKIKGHVYDDVLAAIELWRSVDGQKVYTYSTSTETEQKLLFGHSTLGDCLKHIDGHFDAAIGDKTEKGSYINIAEKVGCKPEDILYLTDNVKEAAAAAEGGLHVALVSRAGNEPLPEDAEFPILHSLEQLTQTNKRKPIVEDEVPAKIMKTENETNSKTDAEIEKVPEKIVNEVENDNTEKLPEKIVNEVEKMEVEEETAKDVNESTTEKEAIVVETTVEDITDKPESNEQSVCEIEPKDTEEKSDEITEKTEMNETEIIKEAEIMETEAVPPANSEEKIGDVDKASSVSAVYTEIEEITDKQSLNEVAEIIEDLEPVVEEPPATEDIEELKNVGEVLEKECDEILSKVQNVTNLNNIPLKPLLNPIPEDIMETENTDSNDIVDKILDTELELELKANAEAEINSVKMDQTEDNAVMSIDTSETAENLPCVKESNKSDSIQPEENKNDVTSPEPSNENTDVSQNSEQIAPLEQNKEENNEKLENKDAKEQNSVEISECVKKDTAVTEEKDIPDEKNSNESSTTLENGALTEIGDSMKNGDTKTHVNGKTDNGSEETVQLNGDSNVEDVKSRLTAENGNESVNGSDSTNGDSVQAKSNGNESSTTETPEIKVKTVAPAEVLTEQPKEQATEA